MILRHVSTALLALTLLAGPTIWPDEANACFSCSGSNPKGVGEHNSNKNGGKNGSKSDKSVKSGTVTVPEDKYLNPGSSFGKEVPPGNYTPSGAFGGTGAGASKTKSGGSYSKDACCT